MLNPDHSKTQEKLPVLGLTFLTSILRHGLTLAAGVLVAHGFLPENKSAEFSDVALSAALFIATLLWSWAEKKFFVKSKVAPVLLALLLPGLLLVGCSSYPKGLALGVHGNYRGVGYAVGTDGKTVTADLDLGFRK